MGPAYLGLSKNQRLTALCRKIDAGGDGGRSPEHLAQYDLMPCRKFVSGILRIGAFVQRKLARLPIRHEESRTIMRRIAWDYDRLAKLAEEQLADQERGAIGNKT